MKKLCTYCKVKQIHAKGFCSNCYARYLKTGSPERVKVKIKKECVFCGAFGYVKAHGYCNSCYARYRCNGSPEYTKGKKVAPCGFCNEEKEIHARGLCNACYRRYLKNGTSEYQKIKKICSINGCESFVVSKGLCNKHYLRLRRHGHTEHTRPNGWGSKEKHPLYHIWSWLKRSHEICDRWNNFWLFVEDIGERPSNYRFRIIDSTKLANKNNYEWYQGIIRRRNGESQMIHNSKYAKAWRKENFVYDIENKLKKLYGMTLDDYYDLFDAQDGVCAICKNAETAITSNGRIRRLAVDHDHETGKVRGLLCTNCNLGIGNLFDSHKLLNEALSYLK